MKEMMFIKSLIVLAFGFFIIFQHKKKERKVSYFTKKIGIAYILFGLIFMILSIFSKEYTLKLFCNSIYDIIFLFFILFIVIQSYKNKKYFENNVKFIKFTFDTKLLIILILLFILFVYISDFFLKKYVTTMFL